MTMLLDSRVGSVELHPYLHTPHSTCELEYGDIVILGGIEAMEDGEKVWKDLSIGIERKRLNDLINSIDSGRLVAHQLPGMLESFDRQYLVVEGIWKPDDRRRLVRMVGGKFKSLRRGKRIWGTKDVHSALISMVEAFGVHLIMTSNAPHTAAWADDLHYWYNKKHHSILSGEVMMSAPIRVGVSLNGKVNRPPAVALMAKEMTGIKGKRALDLAKYFPSMVDLCAASVDDIMEVPGLGRTFAQGIWNQLRGIK